MSTASPSIELPESHFDADDWDVRNSQSPDILTKAELRQRRSQGTAITTAAVIIAAGNFLTFLSLPWLNNSVLGPTNPAVWVTIGLLLPAALLCVSLYRAYWVRKESGKDVIERLGPYVLTQKLGSGGMGDVFLAEHQLMKRQCAVKLIHSEHARDRDMRRSFEREAKATAQLTHWNTIEIYDYGTSDDGRFYYVMEYLKGVNLWHYVDRFGPMSPERVVYILKQLCDALYEAECNGLVHRDIKPSNIFLTERGQSYDIAKLLDFGLVQPITSTPIRLQNVSTKLHGSPSYMCPEQARGLTPDSRGDLYSLGAVAYYLLAGRPPFIDENPVMLVVAHATTDVPSLIDIGVSIPEDLEKVIMKCLTRDPEDRFASARELREALECCDCNGLWTWKHAEDWWSLNSPASSDLTTASSDAAPTVQFDRDTATDIKKSTRIDYDEPTLIMELSSATAAANTEF